MQRSAWLTLFILTALSPVITGTQSYSCPKEHFQIKGGSYSVSEDGSFVRYNCPENYYPTVKIRHCFRGEWNPLPERKHPQCKRITCPHPRGFENGELNPYASKYYVNDTTHYSCYSGYLFRGSETRVCQANGKWTGSTPICEGSTGHCPDPGIPAGTSISGKEFQIGRKVRYSCNDGLTLIGSKERVCGDDRQWSGSEPECYADFTYDTPEEASDSFSSSLRANLQVAQELEGTAWKKIQVHVGGKLDIYIALDVSGSIETEDFKKAKDVIKTLIEKISYYEVSPNYEILIFATKVRNIISMHDFKIAQENKLGEIIKDLESLESDSSELKGTNIALAYKKILYSMKNEMKKNKKDFQTTQQVIIMFNDGVYNMGGSPKKVVDQIKSFVAKNKLEMYVFGIGEEVNSLSINDLKTDRVNEKFFFKLKDLTELQKTFDTMIDEGNSVALCGLYKDYDDQIDSHKRHQYPWLAKISVFRHSQKRQKISNCGGSLVSPTFILTAAHCFNDNDTPDTITVKLETQALRVKRHISHPRYNIKAKESYGIAEYYEFDIALIELEEPVTMSPSVRPICLPCTKETNGALRLSDKQGTCKKHKDMLMNAEIVPAAFMSKVNNIIQKKSITIKQGNRWDACVEDAKKAKGNKDAKAAIVTENFLCSGGNELNEYATCKGDSGGAVFVVPGGRVVQVGIVSWGVNDLCARNPNAKSQSHTRDFHTNLFSQEVRSFLQIYLGDENLGTPLTFM